MQNGPGGQKNIMAMGTGTQGPWSGGKIGFKTHDRKLNCGGPRVRSTKAVDGTIGWGRAQVLSDAGGNKKRSIHQKKKQGEMVVLWVWGCKGSGGGGGGVVEKAVSRIGRALNKNGRKRSGNRERESKKRKGGNSSSPRGGG